MDKQGFFVEHTGRVVYGKFASTLKAEELHEQKMQMLFIATNLDEFQKTAKERIRTGGVAPELIGISDQIVDGIVADLREKMQQFPNFQQFSESVAVSKEDTAKIMSGVVNRFIADLSQEIKKKPEQPSSKKTNPKPKPGTERV